MFRPLPSARAPLARIAPVAPLALALLAACAEDPVAPRARPAPSAALQATVTVTVAEPSMLGPLAIRDASHVSAVSPSGDWVVGSSYTAQANAASGVGTAWVAGQAPSGIGGFGFSASSLASGPYAMNGAGQLAGVENVGDTLTAVLWTPAVAGAFGAGTSTRVAPSPLPPVAGDGWVNSSAQFLSPSGLVGGWLYARNAPWESFVERCYAWLPTSPNATTGSATMLTVPDGPAHCLPTALARGTQLLGFTRAVADPNAPSADRPARAFRWNPAAGSFARLFTSDFSNVPAAANLAGQIAGTRQAVPGGAWDAYLWTPDAPDAATGALQSLGADVHSPILNDAGHLAFARKRADGLSDGVVRIDGVEHALPRPAGAMFALPLAMSEPVATSPTTVRVIVGGYAQFPNFLRLATRWEVTLVRSVPGDAITPAVDAVTVLVDTGLLNGGNANALLGKLDAAQRMIARGQTTPARNLLSAVLNEVSALVASGKLTAAQAQPLVSAVQAAIAAL